MKNESEEYLDRVQELIGRLRREALPDIDEAANRVCTTLRCGGRVYFFGCTHAGILTQEAYYRTGGLAVFNPIFAPGLTVDSTPITITSELERTGGYGPIIARQAGLREGDLLFIHSVSGRNHVPVELALAARELGVSVIGITSLQYSKESASRHPSGKRLFEVCDLVIDDLCPFGDALLRVPHSGVGVAPGSTVLGAAIVNAIAARVAAAYDKEGLLPPVYSSANVDRGGEYNRKVYETYRDQICYEMV